MASAHGEPTLSQELCTLLQREKVRTSSWPVTQLAVEEGRATSDSLEPLSSCFWHVHFLAACPIYR